MSDIKFDLEYEELSPKNIKTSKDNIVRHSKKKNKTDSRLLLSVKEKLNILHIAVLSTVKELLS